MEIFQELDLTPNQDTTTWVDLPFDEAVEVFEGMEILTAAEFYALQDAYRLRAFTVGTGYSDFAIKRTKDVLEKALAEGMSKREFVYQMQEWFDIQGLTRDNDYHLRTVFDTNILGSYQHGRWRQMRNPLALRLRPYWQYRTVGDKRVRESHKEMDGKIFPATSPVWSTWYPPNGFNCRCRVDPISAEEAQRLGIEEISPPAELVPDKGFAASPEDWLEAA